VFGPVLQCVAVCCSVWPCVAVCCSVLQCLALCCSVLQCVADEETSRGTTSYTQTVFRVCISHMKFGSKLTLRISAQKEVEALAVAQLVARRQAEAASGEYSQKPARYWIYHTKRLF